MDPPAANSYFQVTDRSPEELILAIKDELDNINGGVLQIPDRVTNNLTYVSGKVCMKPWDVLEFRKPSSKTMQRYKYVLEHVVKLLRNNRSITKRALYYKYVSVFVSQDQCDTVIDDICCLLHTTRRSLKIEAYPEGMVKGNLVIREDGRNINLLTFDRRGRSISAHMPSFDIVSSDLRFILVNEKEAAYKDLIDTKFNKKVKCLLINAKGMPDVATRFFLSRLNKLLIDRGEKVPILALVDADPHGLQIMSVYTCGSRNLAFDSDNLVTPGIKWLGVRLEEQERWNLQHSKLTNTQKTVAGRLRKDVAFINNRNWKEAVKDIFDRDMKCDLVELTPKMVLLKVKARD